MGASNIILIIKLNRRTGKRILKAGRRIRKLTHLPKCEMDYTVLTFEIQGRPCTIIVLWWD